MVTIERLRNQSIVILPSDVVPDWNSAGITNQTIFSYRFLDVAEKASVIHFNLDGIGNGTQALEWAKQNGIQIVRGIEGNRNGTLPSPITSHELLTISMDEGLCAKTIFYRLGGNIPLNPPPVIDIEAKAIICSNVSNIQG